MAPSKTVADNGVSSSYKRKEGDGEGEGEGEGVSVITSSLTHLTLDGHTHQDVACLEAHLAHISLSDRRVLLVEDLKEEREEEEREEEEERDSERQEEADSEEEIDAVKEVESISCELNKLTASEVVQDYIAKEEGKEEDKKEEQTEQEKEVKKDEGKEEEEEEEEVDGKIVTLKAKYKLEVKEEEEKEEVSDDVNVDKAKLEEKEEEEEEVSDDENPPDDEDKSCQPQTKDKNLRSRGFGQGLSQNMGYVGGRTYQQQQQQQQLPQYSPQYPGVWGAQHCQQVEGGPEASPSQVLADWCGYSQLDSGSEKAFNPSLGEYSPISCASGYGAADSPVCYEDIINTTSGSSGSLPQLQRSQQQQQQPAAAAAYHQGLSHPLHYQDHQSHPPLYNHYQDHHQVASFPQYQESQTSPCQPGFTQILSPPQYPDASCQGSPYPMHMSPHSTYSNQSFQPSILTPPVSPPSPPQPIHTPPPLTAAAAATAGVVTPAQDDIVKVIALVMEQDNFDMSPNDRRIIDIKRNLLDFEETSTFNIEDKLDPQVFKTFYRNYALIENEALVEGDVDGDISYMRTACTKQMTRHYNEELVAFTERVQNMNLCCGRVVDWRVMRCQMCGQSDSSHFYTPLSWQNNYDEMLLSNLVILMFPDPVIRYINKKVLQRPTDLQRTFLTHCELFCEKTELYPCLLEGLKKVGAV